MKALTTPKKNVGFVEIDFGDKISYSPISRYKGKKDKRDLVQILSLNPLAVRYHYEAGVGYYYCYGGGCCNRGNPVNIRYVFPIVVFDTDVRGKIVSDNFEISYLQLGSEAYENLILKYEINADLGERAILISCSDEKYQRLSLEVAGESPLKTKPELQKLVLESYQELRPHIPASIARLVSNDAELNAILKRDDDVSEEEIAEFEARSASQNKQMIDAVVTTVTEPETKPAVEYKDPEDFIDEFDDL